VKRLKRWNLCSQPDCKENVLARELCKRHYVQRRRSDDPERALEHQCRQYGVTAEWYREREAAQNGCCAMCGRSEWAKRNGKVKRLSVDHDHDTNAPRELLCSRCNMIVGILEHEHASLGIEYLARHGKMIALAVEPMPQA
jgi:hypothetical protein